MQSHTTENVHFWVNFKGPHRNASNMDEHIQNELEQAGENLRANHDDEIIDEVITDVEENGGPTGDMTAEILRIMVKDAAKGGVEGSAE